MNSEASEAIIEVSIPMHYFDAEFTDDAECAICMHRFCQHDKCCLSATKLSCCSQPLCCKCFAKVLRRCRCTPDCERVVGTCPFCRDMCRSDTLSVFLSRQHVCRACQK